MGSEVFAHEAPCAQPSSHPSLTVNICWCLDCSSYGTHCLLKKNALDLRLRLKMKGFFSLWTSVQVTSKYLRGSQGWRVSKSAFSNRQTARAQPSSSSRRGAPCASRLQHFGALPRCRWCCCPSAEITAAPKLAVSPTSETGGVRVFFKML